MTLKGGMSLTQGYLVTALLVIQSPGCLFFSGLFVRKANLVVSNLAVNSADELSPLPVGTSQPAFAINVFVDFVVF